MHFLPSYFVFLIHLNFHDKHNLSNIFISLSQSSLRAHQSEQVNNSRKKTFTLKKLFRAQHILKFFFHYSFYYEFLKATFTVARVKNEMLCNHKRRLEVVWKKNFYYNYESKKAKLQSWHWQTGKQVFFMKN